VTPRNRSLSPAAAELAAAVRAHLVHFRPVAEDTAGAAAAAEMRA